MIGTFQLGFEGLILEGVVNTVPPTDRGSRGLEGGITGIQFGPCLDGLHTWWPACLVAMCCYGREGGDLLCFLGLHISIDHKARL